MRAETLSRDVLGLSPALTFIYSDEILRQQNCIWFSERCGHTICARSPQNLRQLGVHSTSHCPDRKIVRLPSLPFSSGFLLWCLLA